MAKSSYKQVLTVAVLTAIVSSAPAFAADTTDKKVKVGYVPSIASGETTQVTVPSSVPNTTAVQPDKKNKTTADVSPVSIPDVGTPEQNVGVALTQALWPDVSETMGVKPMETTVSRTVREVAGKKAFENNTVISFNTIPAQYVSGVTEEKLTPFIGKTITGITVTPVPSAYVDKLDALLTTKVGDRVSEEGITADISALAHLGVFSEITPAFTVVPEGVKVEYRLTPNPAIKDVSISGNSLYSTPQIEKYLDIATGRTLNSVVVGAKIQGINVAYARDGYILAHVSNVQVTPTGDLHISIVEGVVEDIIVKGNTKTKKHVVTREMLQKVGQPFNKFLARRSMQKIYNLGYFEDVNMRLLPGSTPDKVIIEVDVLEQRTGTVTVGAGYSESDGFVGIIELGENNLRGTGDKINLHWEFGGNTDNRNYSATYTRPWINNNGDSLSFNIFDRKDEYTDYQSDGSTYSKYDRRSRGFGFTLGRQSNVFTREYLSLDTRDDSWVDAVSGVDYSYYPSYLNSNFGRTNSLTYQRVFDSRDNIYDPSEGKRYSYSAQYAGHGLGGDFDFYKFSGEARTYKKVGHAHVLAFRVGAGFATGEVPYSQLFSVGGSNTLRGYEDDQFRGRKFYNATTEYRFPLVKKVQGVLFADIGSAWDSPNVPWHLNGEKFNIGVGPGLRIQTPIGPIRLDYGWGRDGGKFTFAFGGQF